VSAFAEDCTKYIQLHAKQARLKVRMEVLRERILPELRGGKHSPRDLPYILVLQKRLRTLADWKEALKVELIGWLKNEAQAEARVKEIHSQFPTQETEALCVEINKTFAAKL
jgi:hypothetical protein